MSVVDRDPSLIDRLSTRYLLHSIAEVTEHQDRRNFRRSLAETIREIVPVQELVFASPLNLDHGVTYQVLHSAVWCPADQARLAGEAVVAQGAFSTQNIEQMTRSGRHLVQEAGTATLLLPVLHHDRLIEVVVLRAEAIPSSTLEIMVAFIRLYRNFLALIRESETDPLTGLYNRKTLEVGLRSVVREAGVLSDAHRLRDSKEHRHHPAGRRAYLAVLDIDHFKRINDRLGHVFGDEVIILVARLMREIFRDEDALFRYGGEEFIVVLLAANRTAALTALERFRERVAAHRFPQLDRLTVSIGFVEIEDDQVVSSVIGKADKALYHSKATGRNRTTDYGDLLASGVVAEKKVFGGVDLF